MICCGILLVESFDAFLADLITMVFQNMFRKTLTLPSDRFSRGRIIGKDGKKIQDIQEVSSAAVVVSGSEVHISAEKEESVKLAERLVMKALEHLEASNVKQKTVKLSRNVVKADITMAVYFTKGI
jgi:rRNA processing protein Krr1/Pno1